MRLIIFMVLVLLSVPLVAGADEKISVLKAGSVTYSNITVTTVSKTDVYFTYAGGMGNVKIKNLSPELQKHFSFDPKKAQEVELKQAENKAKYQSQVIRQSAARSGDDFGNSQPSSTPAAYSDVEPEYRSSTITKVGDVAPISSVHTIDGHDVDLRGKVVVLDFFATWCGPCMEEMPYVERNLWQGLKSDGLIVIGLGREHSEAEIRQFQKQKGYSFLFAADSKREIYSKFATNYIPRCVLIGKDGRIKCQTVGFSGQDFTGFVNTTKSELHK